MQLHMLPLCIWLSAATDSVLQPPNDYLDIHSTVIGNRALEVLQNRHLTLARPDDAPRRDGPLGSQELKANLSGD